MLLDMQRTRGLFLLVLFLCDIEVCHIHTIPPHFLVEIHLEVDTMREEVWKDIEGYEGYYQISNMGRVKSLKRTVWDKGGFYRTVAERILKVGKDGKGYSQVTLCKEGKGKTYKVHRLVASAFCANPENYNEVNHISEDKEDNRVSNLEYCSRSYNINHGTGIKRSAETRRNNPNQSKPIIGVDKVTGLILEFPSINEAVRQLRIKQSHIWECCNGRRNSAGGFTWFYADDDTE